MELLMQFAGSPAGAFFFSLAINYEVRTSESLFTFFCLDAKKSNKKKIKAVEKMAKNVRVSPAQKRTRRKYVLDGLACWLRQLFCAFACLRRSDGASLPFS
jgi:hypothetical protein